MDGFPVNRDQWTSMIEHGVLPDSVVVLDDENTPPDYLLKRFTEQHKLPHPSTFKQTADKASEGSHEKVCKKEKERERKREREREKESERRGRGGRGGERAKEGGRKR